MTRASTRVTLLDESMLTALHRRKELSPREYQFSSVPYSAPPSDKLVSCEDLPRTANAS
jgi:hypothetical protein